MTPTRWVLVGAVAFAFLALRLEVREAALALIDPISTVEVDEPYRLGLVQLGVMVLALTGGLALLVHWLKPESPTGRIGGLGSRKGFTGRASTGDRVDTPVGMYQSKKSGGVLGRRR